ncbi:DUF1345 domain-containing protein [Lysinimonas soli]|uniref:DUF1345 domain-containing protein n=1 Tax=Lysinimonas soli TaxID=1074233 RepID=A0ABW0NPE1_9MICO
MATRTPRAIPEQPEQRWPAIVAVTVAVVVYVLLPSTFLGIPRYILPIVATLLLIPLIVLNPRHFTRETAWSRWLSITLGGVLTIANQIEVVGVVQELLSSSAHGPQVLLTALQVWVTDIIAFGLVYWEVDGRGPVSRRLPNDPEARDFRFPQEDTGKPTSWRPAFFDYLYFSLTNMMAFSPTDVMPLTHRAKALMAVQSITGFGLLALVIARAVNILT